MKFLSSLSYDVRVSMNLMHVLSSVSRWKWSYNVLLYSSICYTKKPLVVSKSLFTSLAFFSRSCKLWCLLVFPCICVATTSTLFASYREAAYYLLNRFYVSTSSLSCSLSETGDLGSLFMDKSSAKFSSSSVAKMCWRLDGEWFSSTISAMLLSIFSSKLMFIWGLIASANYGFIVSDTGLIIIFGFAAS